MKKLKLLNEVDYEYYETSMIRQFSKPKEVKYEVKFIIHIKEVVT